ncbi:MAG: hypothetical protein FJX60_02855 [Alphaproteobacteria bacterium]|nr:hypothetical protein [Alphaproteobacteria bacterium]
MEDAFDPAMTRMTIAAAFWVLLHVVLAGSPLRWIVAGKIGENGFRGLFSILSVIGIVWLAIAYGDATSAESFYGIRLVEPWMLWTPAVLMVPAAILLVGSVTQPNPTMVMGERHLKDEEPARGILRVTRHPMLWSFLLWGIGHFIANGDLASVFLFGSIMLVAAAGMSSIDRKQARRDPERWRRFAAVTSVVPFMAILAGKNRFVFSEIGWSRIAIAVALWVAIVALHPLVAGVPALPS